MTAPHFPDYIWYPSNGQIIIQTSGAAFICHETAQPAQFYTKEDARRYLDEYGFKGSLGISLYSPKYNK